MIGLGGNGALDGIERLIDLGETGVGLIAQGAHRVHLDLTVLGVDGKDGIAQVAHLGLHTVNLAVDLVLLQGVIDAHLAEIRLLIAQQIFGLLRAVIERCQRITQSDKLAIQLRHPIGDRLDLLHHFVEISQPLADTGDQLDGFAQLFAQVLGADLPVNDVENG